MSPKYPTWLSDLTDIGDTKIELISYSSLQRMEYHKAGFFNVQR